MVVRDAITGDERKRIQLSNHEDLYGAPYRLVHRADLHRTLFEHATECDPDILHLKHEVVSFEEGPHGIIVNFCNGTQADCDLLIGADGIKSKVRQQIAKDNSVQYTGDAAWRILVPTSNVPENCRPEQAMGFLFFECV